MIKKEFSKKYANNTSIDAIIRCLYSYKDLTNYYLSLNQIFEHGKNFFLNHKQKE